MVSFADRRPSITLGPANQVLPPGKVSSWVEVLLPLTQAREAIASMAQHTGDGTRDLATSTLTHVRLKLKEAPDADRLLTILDGEVARDTQSLSRIFGEELPSGLVIRATAKTKA